LPAGREVPTEMKLRTIQTQGYYDIAAEQNIPNFAAAVRHLEWSLVSDAFGDSLDTSDQRNKAVQKYITDNNYQSHGSQGDYYYIGAASAVFNSVERQALTWDNDPSLPTPAYYGAKNIRTYLANLYYDIYEIHDMATGQDEENWELDEVPLGSVCLQVEYTVELSAKWVSN
jgi:hypothetical protein